MKNPTSTSVFAALGCALALFSPQAAPTDAVVTGGGSSQPTTTCGALRDIHLGSPLADGRPSCNQPSWQTCGLNAALPSRIPGDGFPKANLKFPAIL